jgi:ATP-binding cassette subfamily B protein
VDHEQAQRRAGWRLMGGAIRLYRGWVVVGIVAGLGWTAARVSVPALTGKAIDNGIVNSDTSAALRWTVLILAVGVVQAVCTGVRRYAAFRLALRVETDLRMRLAAHLQQLHFAFHDQAQTGQLMARANTDIQQINQVVLLIPLTIASTLSMVAVVVILLLRSPGLALFGLGALPFLNVAATRFTRRMFPVGLAQQEELADLSGVVEESVTGVRVVKGFGAERLQERRLGEEVDAVYTWSMAAARLRAGFLPLIDLLPTLGLVGILWYGGHQVLQGDLTIGDIVAANFYVLMLIWPLRMVGMLLGQLSRSAAAAGRVHEVLATDPEIIDRHGARPLPEGPGEVRFEGVRFR